jgi:FKBP-type peptidyl-prolyl cis-trans isomerase
MRTNCKATILALVITTTVVGLRAADPSNTAPAKPGANSAMLKNEKDRLSYSVGMQLGTMIKRNNLDVDISVVSDAMNDIIAGKQPKMSEPEAKEVMMTYQRSAATKREEDRKKQSEKNKAEGEKFLAGNKSKSGVKTKSVTLPDGSKAELQYKIITEGKGPIPMSNDVVEVNYKGTLINGTEFDSSSKHGDKPAKFPVNRVIRGWTEALEMMPVGSKWTVYIPSTLGYGDMGAGPTIEAGSTLVFEMELVAIEPKTPPSPPPAPAAPLTSDIIRVPSADELKKGAKIEVLKPEDVEKAKKEAEQQQPKK